MKKFWRKSWQIVRYLTLRLLKEGHTYRAASLAYTTALAIVPILIAIFTILGYVPFFYGAAQQIQQLIITNFVAQSAATITEYLTEFLAHAHHLSSLNIAFLIALDVLMLYNIHQAFNAIWHTKPRWHLSFSFFVYFIVLMLSPLIFGGVLVLGSFVFKLPWFGKMIAAPYIKKPLFILMPHLIVLITFTIFNGVLPSCRVRFIHALSGGIVTTLLFECAKTIFTVYLSHFHTYKILYGTLATFPIFLIWLYVSWLIILLGALITHLFAQGIPPFLQKKLEEP